MDNFPFLCILFNGTFPLDGIIKCNSDTELNSVSFVVPEIQIQSIFRADCFIFIFHSSPKLRYNQPRKFPDVIPNIIFIYVLLLLQVQLRPTYRRRSLAQGGKCSPLVFVRREKMRELIKTSRINYLTETQIGTLKHNNIFSL